MHSQKAKIKAASLIESHCMKTIIEWPFSWWTSFSCNDIHLVKGLKAVGDFTVGSIFWPSWRPTMLLHFTSRDKFYFWTLGGGVTGSCRLAFKTEGHDLPLEVIDFFTSKVRKAERVTFKLLFRRSVTDFTEYIWEMSWKVIAKSPRKIALIGSQCA